MKNPSINKLYELFLPPKVEKEQLPDIPELEKVFIQFYTWRKYMRWVKDNNVVVDPAEEVLMHNTYKVIRQELKIRLGVMRRLVEENFGDMVIKPLLEVIKNRKEEMLANDNTEEKT